MNIYFKKEGCFVGGGGGSGIYYWNIKPTFLKNNFNKYAN